MAVSSATTVRPRPRPDFSTEPRPDARTTDHVDRPKPTAVEGDPSKVEPSRPAGPPPNWEQARTDAENERRVENELTRQRIESPGSTTPERTPNTGTRPFTVDGERVDPPAKPLYAQDRDWSKASRSDVRALQRELVADGRSPGRVDGVWGPKTKAARDAARADYDNPARPDLIASDRDWSKASKADVESLQRQLKAGGDDPGKVDGVWGRRTKAALDAARARRTPKPADDTPPVPTPKPDRTPEVPIPEKKPAAAEVPTAETPPPGERTPDLDKLPSDLVLTDEDWSKAKPERVTQLQQALTDAGIDVGKVDGKWGDKTSKGLDYARFAIEHDLKRTSIYDKQPTADTVVPPSDDPIAVPSDAERRKALLSRSVDDWSKAPAQDVRDLQTFLKDKGYDVGKVDGKWGGRTRDALEIAQRRQKLLDGYQDTNSTVGDIARTISPLPTNMDNLLLSKLGLSTAITNDSLGDDEKLAIYDVANAAIERTGRTIGGTKYDDYGRPEFNDYFNKGNVTHDALMSSFSDPQFRMASTLGRFTYMQDPENKDRIYVFDGYDWNTNERNFDPSTAKDDTARRYRQLRNDMREMEKKFGKSGADSRVFLVLDRAEMEAIRARLRAN